MTLHQRTTADIAATRSRMASPVARERLDMIWAERNERIRREAEQDRQGRPALKRIWHRLAVEPTEAP